MSDEYTRRAREHADANHGEGTFDQVLAEANTAAFLKRLEDPEYDEKIKKADQEIEALYSGLLGYFTELHGAVHAEDQNYVEYASIVLATNLNSLTPTTLSLLLFEALTDLGSIAHHRLAGDELG